MFTNKPKLTAMCQTACTCLNKAEPTPTQELEQAKLEFLSLSSHELRTPLASISLSAELLLRGVREINEDQRFFLEEIYINAQKMSQLISNFMDLARIEMGALSVNPEPIDAAEAIEHILDEMEVQIANKGVSLCRDFDRHASAMVCDKKIFTVVMDNLLSNALKYTKPGGTVMVCVKPSKAGTVVCVKDSGIGIPEEDISCIFDKRFRAKNAVASRQEGNGLGLYVVKSLLDRTDASISVTSAVGAGSEFKVVFPVAQE